MLNSDYRPLCSVKLPFAYRQMHMQPFNLNNRIMPEGFDDYLQAVNLLCDAANANRGVAYLTIDEKLVEAGASQRKPKPHVDGYWVAATNSWDLPDRWVTSADKMPLIVASSVSGCKAWRGNFDAIPMESGDLSHIADKLIGGEILAANKGYILSGDCIHESVIFNEPVKRSFLRITLPTEYKYAA